MPLPDIRKRVESVDWEKLIGGVPDRRNLPYLRQDDFKNPRNDPGAGRRA